MKLQLTVSVPAAGVVAPRAGAWIETTTQDVRHGEEVVAPRAGAWIETVVIASQVSRNSGRPPRGGVD